MTNAHLHLTDWDCFVIRRAIFSYSGLFLGRLRPKKRRAKKIVRCLKVVYNSVCRNRHYIICQLPILRRIRFYVEKLRNSCKDNNNCFDGISPFVASFYSPVINKLTYSYLKAQNINMSHKNLAFAE